MKCAYCGHENPEESVFCEKCIYLLQPPKVLLPVVHLCISLAQGVARKVVPVEKFLEELDGVRTHLSEYQAKTKEIPRGEGVPDAVSYARENLDEAYRIFGEGLTEMALYAEDRHASHLLAGLVKLLESSTHLFQVDFVAEAAQKSVPTPIACLKCGSPNIPGARHCERCNALLPQIFAGKEPSAVAFVEGSLLPQNLRDYQSSHFLRLKESVQAAQEGRIGPQEFEESLNFMIRLVAQAKEQFGRVEVPSGSEEPEAAKVFDWMKSGLELYQKGLDELKAFVRDGEQHHLSQGLAQAQEGSEKLLLVVLLDQERRKQEEPASRPGDKLA